MAYQDIAEWTSFGIGTWIRFKVSSHEAVDMSIFEPLAAWVSDFRTVWYGRIEESPDECLLVVAWKTSESYDRFKQSAQHEELMAKLRANSSIAMEPETQTIIFSRTMFFSGFGPNTEVLTAYLPTSASPENQSKVHLTRRLVHSYEVGPPKSRCYGKPPNFGWMDGLHTWNGEQVLAGVWCNFWKDKESEQRFKTTEKRYEANQVETPLAVDVFEQDLRNLGVIGFRSFHADFKLFIQGTL